ncbi:hypothetical protein TWF506_004047 [Arthrobotrys conoides]|uniref:Uncharacterized protein n=1 Tax=Arthrobotrys conoides TaxID=74498 RepID=A0AAN8RIK9_9PEZI
MEAIGLAASIVGLIAAGAKFIPWLVEISKKTADAPDSVQAMMFELNETSIILKGIQIYIIEEERAAARRKSLISLENISITLTGFVVTFSDLEKHLDFVKAGGKISSFDRSKWVLREKDILDVLRRLQHHKASLSLMLNIINASSHSKAAQLVDNLCQSVKGALQQNQTLLSQLEHRKLLHDTSISEKNTITDIATVSDSSSVANDAESTVSSIKPNKRIRNRFPISSFSFDVNAIKRRKGPLLPFEKDLVTSWVYKRSGFNLSGSSIWSREGSERGIALSTLSQLTWAEISNISVFSLPIFQVDIYNGYHYDTPDRKSGASESAKVAPDKQPAPALPHIDLDGITKTISGSLIPTTPTSKTSRATLSPLKAIDLIRQRSPFISKLPLRPKDRFIGHDDILARIVTRLSPEAVVKASSLTVLGETKEDVFLIEEPKDGTGGGTNTRVFVLWGGIGAGKSRMALEYAYQTGNGLPTPRVTLGHVKFNDPSSVEANEMHSVYNYVIWVDAKTKDRAEESLSEFGRRLKPEPHFRVSAQFVIHFLNLCHLPWLLIFDDLDDFATIKDYWPRSSKGSIIITTRDPELYINIYWTIRPDGVVQGNVAGKFPLILSSQTLFYQEVPDLAADSAYQLFESKLRYGTSSLTTEAQRAGFISAIGSSPALINAAAEAINVGLISIGDVCRRGYVDMEALEVKPIRSLVHDNTASIAMAPQYQRITTQWDDQVRNLMGSNIGVYAYDRPLLLPDTVLHLLACFNSHHFQEKVSSWIGKNLCGVDGRVGAGPISGAWPKRPLEKIEESENNKLTSDIRRIRRLLGGFPRSSSRFYRLSGTFRQYLARQMAWGDRQIHLHAASRLISDILPIDPSGDAHGNPTDGPTTVREGHGDLMELYQLLVSYFYIPDQSRFSITYFTTLRKIIGATIANRRPQSYQALEQVAGYLNQSMGIKTVIYSTRDEFKIYGKQTTAAFEVAALRTIYAADASRSSDWIKAIAGYRQAGAEFLATCPKKLNGNSGLLEHEISQNLVRYFDGVKNSDDEEHWPMERVIIFNTKIARCRYKLGREAAAEYQLETETPSAGTWFSDWKPFLPKDDQEWPGVLPWDCYNSYRCGYARLTLGIIGIRQNKLYAAEESLESAIESFSRCSAIDYMQHYTTTANALLGWVRIKLGEYINAIYPLETAHRNYSSPHWASTPIYHGGYFEVAKRLCRIEYMLSLAYGWQGNQDTWEYPYWRDRAEDSISRLVPYIIKGTTRHESYETLTDFGISDLFSMEEVMMDWMIV